MKVKSELHHLANKNEGKCSSLLGRGGKTLTAISHSTFVCTDILAVIREENSLEDFFRHFIH